MEVGVSKNKGNRAVMHRHGAGDCRTYPRHGARITIINKYNLIWRRSLRIVLFKFIQINVGKGTCFKEFL